MRTVIGVLVVAALATPAAAQKQTELRLGGMTLATRRHVAFDSSVGRASTSRTGGEFLLRGDGGGIGVSYLKGDFGTGLGAGFGQLTLLEGTLMLGPRAFAIEAGYRRQTTGAKLFGDDEGEDLILAGANSFVDLGPSGFGISFAGGGIARIKKDSLGSGGGKPEIAGWRVSTGLLYQAPRGIPLFVFAGYRFERFKTPERSGIPSRREEMSGIVIEGGIRWLP